MELKQENYVNTNNGYVYLDEQAFKNGKGVCYISEFELSEKQPLMYTRRKLRELLRDWVFSCDDGKDYKLKKNKINKYLDYLWCDLEELGWCDPSCFIDEWEDLADEDFEEA